MHSTGNNTLSIPIISFRSSQPQPIDLQTPISFVEFHNPPSMPIMRSRAQRRVAEKQAMKITRVGGPNLHRPQINRAELVKRIQRQRDTNSALLARDASPATTSSLCEEFALVYNYDGLASTASGLFDQFAAGMHSLSEYLPALHIGPPLAEAASIRPKEKNNKQTNIGSFIASFEKNFDIRKSVDLASGDSLRGVTVIMGELHNHFVIRQQITDVLKRMQAENGDLLLCEGGSIICKKSAKIYNIPFQNCVSIEEGFPAYVDSKNLVLEHEKKLLKEVEFIQSKIKPRPEDVDKSDALTYSPFIEKYWRLLPEKYMPEYQILMISSKRAGYMAMDFVESQNGPREKNMLGKIKQNHHPESTNFVIVGGLHLFNLFKDLSQSKGGKVIMMMPYAVYETFPKLSLPLERHDEL